MRHRHEDKEPEPEITDRTDPAGVTGAEPVPVGTEPKAEPKEEPPLGPEGALAKQLLEMLYARSDKETNSDVRFCIDHLHACQHQFMILPALEEPPVADAPNPDNLLNAETQ